jgi:predicted MPP superfamily phosphohydrolase
MSDSKNDTCSSCNSHNIAHDLENNHIICKLCGNKSDDQSTIGWLHLSDLHFREVGNNFEMDPVVSSLLLDISKFLKNKNRKLDFIVISGDLAYSGITPEYDCVKSFLEKLKEISGVSNDRIFLVPGNHDVNIQKNTNPHLGIQNALTNYEDLQKFLNDDKKSKAIFSRQSEYFSFYEKTWEKVLKKKNFVNVQLM